LAKKGGYCRRFCSHLLSPQNRLKHGRGKYNKISLKNPTFGQNSWELVFRKFFLTLELEAEEKVWTCHYSGAAHWLNE
jgi:hypothetical protein